MAGILATGDATTWLSAKIGNGYDSACIHRWQRPGQVRVGREPGCHGGNGTGVTTISSYLAQSRKQITAAFVSSVGCIEVCVQTRLSQTTQSGMSSSGGSDQLVSAIPPSKTITLPLLYASHRRFRQTPSPRCPESAKLAKTGALVDPVRVQTAGYAARIACRRRRSCFSISMTANSVTPIPMMSRPSRNGTASVPNIACSAGR